MAVENVAADINTDVESFEFIYEGPDVSQGSMNVRQVADVLNGVTRAFSTISHEHEYGDTYELRFRDVEHASFHLLFQAIAFAKANPAAASAIVAGAAIGLEALNKSVSGAYKVITDIGAMLNAKKKLKGQRVALTPAAFPNGEVQLETLDGLVLLTKEQYELLLSRRVDRQLAQIVSPLQPNRVDSFEMRRSGQELASVDAVQRSFFDFQEVSEERSREGTELIGTLNSLTKTSLRGTFYTSDGVHVPYRYIGGDINLLLRGFASRELLRVRGRIKYGNDNIPTLVEVRDIELLQQTIP